MGLIWRSYQQMQIAEGSDRTDSLDDRVRDLELRCSIQESALRALTDHLERKYGEDLTGDGSIGLPPTN